jgi:hypothetical protein
VRAFEGNYAVKPLPLFELDGSEVCEAHYAVLIEPGEIIWTEDGRKLRVFDVLPVMDFAHSTVMFRRWVLRKWGFMMSPSGMPTSTPSTGFTEDLRGATSPATPVCYP